jgi:FeoB-associated Cys-rich membrane protein
VESMLAQTVVAALIVVGAVLFLSRRAWRAISASRARASERPGCGSGCGCAGTSPEEPRRVQ